MILFLRVFLQKMFDFLIPLMNEPNSIEITHLIPYLWDWVIALKRRTMICRDAMVENAKKDSFKKTWKVSCYVREMQQ